MHVSEEMVRQDKIRRERRWKGFLIDADLLDRILKGELVVSPDEMPQGSLLINISLDSPGHALQLLVGHESFPAVPDRERAPSRWVEILPRSSTDG